MPHLYDDRFFGSLREVTAASADVVVPMVMDLVGPRRIVDVGCGEGIWLRRFLGAGADEVLGVDGPQARSGLQIPAQSFREADLEAGLPRLPAGFDLAVCLEVAEHLPETEASSLVQALVGAAPAVLFSAAIPGQDGVHHINCQWPEYWSALFARHGYVAVDCLRPAVWGRAEVAFYYQQNLLLYLAPDQPRPEGFPAGTPTRLVHPATYETLLVQLSHTVPRATGPLARELARTAPRTAVRLIVQAWHRRSYTAPRPS